MTEPVEKIRVGMTGRKEVVVTRELTVGGHVEGMPLVYGTPMGSYSVSCWLGLGCGDVIRRGRWSARNFLVGWARSED